MNEGRVQKKNDGAANIGESLPHRIGFAAVVALRMGSPREERPVLSSPTVR